MTIELGMAPFITLLIALVGLVIGTVRLLWARIEKSLDARHELSEKSRADGFRRVEDQILRSVEIGQANQNEIQRLEKDFLKFQNECARQYVNREDYIRGQTVIEAKVDAVMASIQTLQVKQAVVEIKTTEAKGGKCD